MSEAMGARVRALSLAALVPLGCGAPNEHELGGEHVGDPSTAEGILERSFAAYQQATDYSDRGEAVVTSQGNGDIQARAVFRTQFSRGQATSFELHPAADEVPPFGYVDVSRRLHHYGVSDDGGLTRLVTSADRLLFEYESLHAAVTSGWRGGTSLAEQVMRTALAALAAEDGAGDPFLELYDLALVVPSERGDCHEIHAQDAFGWQVVLFVSTDDYLLREWRQHAEFPPLRWHDNPLRRELERAKFDNPDEYAFLARQLSPRTEPEYVEDVSIYFDPALAAPSAAVPIVVPGGRMIIPKGRGLTEAVDGIGVMLAASSAGWTVGRTYPGPARRADVRRGDLIVEVDGVEITRHSRIAAGWLIEGAPGTSVRLSLLRDEQLFEVSMTRERLAFSWP